MTGEPEFRPTPDLIRPMLESAIERLIAILDEISPDPDLEDNGDGEPDEDGEPLYGWTGMEGSYGRYSPEYNGQGADELELDDADDEPDLGSLDHMNQTRWSKGKDAEPSLGSLDFPFDQTKWSKGGTKDFEDEHDGREPCCEDEGAQCDDEGCVETDLGADEDEGDHWGKSREEQEATTKACQAAIEAVRTVQGKNGQAPIRPLPVLGGAIWKG